ncbi:hypothetical protein J0K78_05005 [Halobacillus sp. GSS1]|uniref:hypothetical protein n=1 Tax=Halobacillus sp. GSS1 TaxID=2815919 RepID=UPI001A8E66ED|nr:hypothetical protein [Halobacillus sp. GSS1]MBN9653619.1 hypothetical protein [Halobacillus sp. GSS1]
MEQINFFEDINLRDDYISRVDTLDKVKDLILLPNMSMATTEQVADYYEVPIEAIRNITKEHNTELREDGFVKNAGKASQKLINKYNPKRKVIENRVGHFIVVTENGEVQMSYSTNAFFSKRAILRIGMLVRDSLVGRDVRLALKTVD